MDGVLAYFDKAARARCGDDYARMGKTEFWTRIAAAPNFFLALDCTADGYDLFSTVTEMLDDNDFDNDFDLTAVRVLTALPGDPFGKRAAAEKRQWCLKSLGMLAADVLVSRAGHSRPTTADQSAFSSTATPPTAPPG